MTGPPTTRQELEDRIGQIAAKLGLATQRARVLVSSVIVAQMLPPGSVVKGGMGIKLRMGEVGTRATRDVDVVARDEADFFAAMSAQLETGWGTVPPSKGQIRKNPDAPPRLAFDGTIRAVKQATPTGVPAGYVMQPYKVTLRFMGSPWASVPLEVAHDEIDGMDHADLESDVADQLLAIAAVLSFGDLAPVPLISLEQQIAQKFHAATHPESERAHDLVDLQLLWHAGTTDDGGLDLALLKTLCKRTFDYRKRHTWPPTASMPALLEEAYATSVQEARLGMDERSTTAIPTAAVQLADTLQDALTWANDRISEVDGAGKARLRSSEGS